MNRSSRPFPSAVEAPRGRVFVPAAPRQLRPLRRPKDRSAAFLTGANAVSLPSSRGRSLVFAKPEEAPLKKPENGRKPAGDASPKQRRFRPKSGSFCRGRSYKWPLMERHFKIRDTKAVPRLVVIDGCNVARSASGRSRENVNCLGLLCVVKFLVSRDIDVVIFLPVVYNNQYNFNAKNLHVLPILNKLNILTFTPARASRGDRDAFINYDDLYVLDFAERYGGCVVSSDRFDDIRGIDEYKKYHEIIDKRRIDVRFQIGCGEEQDRIRGHFPEFFIHGDQLGNESKNPKAAEEHLKASMFCVESDSEFLKTSTRRKMWSSERRAKILAMIDQMLEEMDVNKNSNTHLPSMYSDPKAAKHVFKTRLCKTSRAEEEVFPRNERPAAHKDKLYDCFDDDNLKQWRHFGEEAQENFEDAGGEIETITVIDSVADIAEEFLREAALLAVKEVEVQ
ncbi:hypothetical protein L596_024817 [Steinernema carpocapsae]|uniref:RNase NYN domain-containing protein n=1 Tax=Steinernema carpocapsae TaxID=34508 RepID=A0A4U5M5W2_STECR|nr:hypothetical protein L596_024817 [Steinernema carpocapsae]